MQRLSILLQYIQWNKVFYSGSCEILILKTSLVYTEVAEETIWRNPEISLNKLV